MLALKRSDTIRYSTMEERLFRLLPKDGSRISTDVLVGRYYKERSAPMNPMNVIVGAMKSLSEKATRNKEPFRIQRTELRGPHPAEWWIEKRS